MKRFKLTTKEKFLFLTPFIVLAWPLISYFRQDSLDRTMRQLAGPNAIDCGESFAQTDRYPVLKRSVQAFEARKPFFLRDNNTVPPGSAGLVMTPQGKVYFLSYTRGAWFSKSTLKVSQGEQPRVVNFARGLREVKCRRFTTLSLDEQTRLLKS